MSENWKSVKEGPNRGQHFVSQGEQASSEEQSRRQLRRRALLRMMPMNREAFWNQVKEYPWSDFAFQAIDDRFGDNALYESYLESGLPFLVWARKTNAEVGEDMRKMAVDKMEKVSKKVNRQ